MSRGIHASKLRPDQYVVDCIREVNGYRPLYGQQEDAEQKRIRVNVYHQAWRAARREKGMVVP